MQQQPVNCDIKMLSRPTKLDGTFFFLVVLGNGKKRKPKKKTGKNIPLKKRNPVACGRKRNTQQKYFLVQKRTPSSREIKTVSP